MKIWKVVDKGNYSEVNLSSQKKNRITGQYETDFTSQFVRFVGNAHKQRPMPNQEIEITSCNVQNVYIKDGKKEYLKNPIYVVFGYTLRDQAPNVPQTSVGFDSSFADDDDGLPF